MGGALGQENGQPILMRDQRHQDGGLHQRGDLSDIIGLSPLLGGETAGGENVGAAFPAIAVRQGATQGLAGQAGFSSGPKGKKMPLLHTPYSLSPSITSSTPIPTSS